MTANPASSTIMIGAEANRSTNGRPPATCLEICTTTCAIAPAPSPRNNTAATGEYNSPPSHAPAIVGRPPISPSLISVPTAAEPRANRFEQQIRAGGTRGKERYTLERRRHGPRLFNALVRRIDE